MRHAGRVIADELVAPRCPFSSCEVLAQVSTFLKSIPFGHDRSLFVIPAQISVVPRDHLAHEGLDHGGQTASGRQVFVSLRGRAHATRKAKLSIRTPSDYPHWSGWHAPSQYLPFAVMAI